MGLSPLLVTGVDGRWSPGIGDPTIRGWVTVAAYFYAAYLAARAYYAEARAFSDPHSPDAAAYRTVAKFWLLVIGVMALLGVNKQLDLQTFFMESLREVALARGWYEERRHFQLAFVCAVGVVGILGTAALAYALRGFERVRGAVIGLGLIASFVVIRAASFQHVDHLLHSRPIRWTWLLELGGIALIVRAAAR